MTQKRILIMAGGTGGHIMPGIAVGHYLQKRGWDVVWLGHPERMEGDLVPKAGIPLRAMRFSGVRGKGLISLIKLPFTLLSAALQARKVIKDVQPDVILGMGGYVSFPGGIIAPWLKKPLIIHEQNAVAGTANKYLAKRAQAVLSGFPDVLANTRMVGNPVREELLKIDVPENRYQNRQGPLKILVLGGSLGAKALNTVVPQAMAQLPTEQRPLIKHQAGQIHIEQLEADYKSLGVTAECVAFIDDMAQALSECDLIICRAGAMTVAEVAVAGVAALFVPLPGAIDDHQTANASWLASQEAALIKKQDELTAQWLSQWILKTDREQLLQIAKKAKALSKPEATATIAAVCAEQIKGIAK